MLYNISFELRDEVFEGQESGAEEIPEEWRVLLLDESRLQTEGYEL